MYRTAIQHKPRSVHKPTRKTRQCAQPRSQLQLSGKAPSNCRRFTSSIRPSPLSSSSSSSSTSSHSQQQKQQPNFSPLLRKMSSSSSSSSSSTTTPTSPTPPSTVTFTLSGPQNFSQTITTRPGRSLRQVLQSQQIVMLPCICNGQLQCTTCHVQLSPTLSETLSQPSNEEMDLLDLVPEFIDGQSRLACQLQITSKYQDETIIIPSQFINYMDDPTATPIPTASLLGNNAV